ncbi:Uncharacterized protein PBTT_04083 [Plasmodiophora brassicae]
MVLRYGSDVHRRRRIQSDVLRVCVLLPMLPVLLLGAQGPPVIDLTRSVSWFGSCQ